MSTYKVTLKPSGDVIEVDSNKSLLESLREHDIYVKSSCGGVASCSDCICKVVSGEDNLESPPFAELKLLGNVFHITKERLLCQTKIIGDVTLDISKHDKATDEEKLKAKTNKFSAKKKAQTKVRSKEEFEKIKEDRFQERKQKNENDLNWNRFWEKDQTASGPKKLGGGKRPKFFDTDKAMIETQKELLKSESRRESNKSDNDESKSTNKEFKKFKRD